MDFLTVLVVASCVAVSAMIPTCASDHVNTQESLQQYGSSAAQQAKFTVPNLLPRKLKLQQEIGTNDKNIVAHDKLMEASSDYNKIESEKMDDTTTGKENKSEYLTMDYAWLKRRRPIHNKHVPVNSNTAP